MPLGPSQVKNQIGPYLLDGPIPADKISAGLILKLMPCVQCNTVGFFIWLKSYRS